MKTITFRLKGGPGSGFHGHKGIPGHQGGSLSEGAIGRPGKQGGGLPDNAGQSVPDEPKFADTLDEFKSEVYSAIDKAVEGLKLTNHQISALAYVKKAAADKATWGTYGIVKRKVRKCTAELVGTNLLVTFDTDTNQWFELGYAKMFSIGKLGGIKTYSGTDQKWHAGVYEYISLG